MYRDSLHSTSQQTVITVKRITVHQNLLHCHCTALCGNTSLQPFFLSTHNKLENMKSTRKKLMFATKDALTSTLLGVPKLKLPNSPVPRLLFSNVPPSDSETILAKAAIDEAREECNRIISEKEQQASERTLRLLNRQLKCAQDFIVQHQRVLSPIRRLPQEILQEIFLYFTSVESDTGFHLEKDTRWRVALVCRFWRAAAFSLSSIWTRLPTVHIDFFSYQQSGSRKLFVLNEFLRRSRDAPLDISIWGHSTISRPNYREDPVLPLLLGHSQRFGRLSMEIPFSGFNKLKSIKGRIPLLETLSLRIFAHRLSSNMDRTPLLDIFSIAPKLKVASVSGSGYVKELILPFPQLTQYETSSPTVSVHNSPHLHTLVLASEFFIQDIFQPTISGHPIVTLQNLSKLVIYGNFDDDQTTASRICLPAIAEVYIEATQTPTFCRRIYNSIGQSPGTCRLTKLDLRMQSYSSPNDLILLLQVTPALVDLRAGIFTEDSIWALTVTEGNVLVPRLERCAMLLHSDSVDYDMRLAIASFALVRCEIPRPDEGGQQNKDTPLQQLKVLEIHDLRAVSTLYKQEQFGWHDKESRLQQAYFELWSQCDLGECTNLAVLRLEVEKKCRFRTLHQQYNHNDHCWEETPQILDVMDSLTEIDKFKIRDLKSIISSNLHVFLQINFSNVGPLSDYARRIVQKWARSMGTIIQDLHWAPCGLLATEPLYLTYISDDHPIRSSADDAINLMMYGEDPKGFLSPFTTAASTPVSWPLERDLELESI
ncbi:hypothetical protein BDN70DRAFT_890001 [Pholiota conissans]|uniref:F-box domain-containing protein n=1 Tax=Pholiota conissans TaxID=109636 RepID=A0A9P6D7H6_9AGAR|nr:hypothetical protein BDN70DRAFT_890001 [Pholiota conissans]